MTGRQWRKALWHLRHGGFEGLKKYTQNSASGRETAKSHPVHDPSTRGMPTLSVIVPAFNATDYIERCLSSILEQTNSSLEVIVVDDGSNDATAAKAMELSCKDDRVKVLTGPNAGPAQARNRGVEVAHGKYLAFADADDEVLPDAYANLVNSLERTGSDIATGSYIRIGSAGRSRPKLTSRVHARQRLAVRLDDMPELLEEPVLWNKVYLRDFWNRHVGEMRSFANYEDQEPVYRALVGAAAIDVLTTDVYAWRLADGRNTRSRRKAKLTDLRAKLEVINALGAVLAHEAEPVREHAYAIWVGTDLAMHAEYQDTASKRFRRTLCSATRNLKKSMPRAAWKLIPAQDRLFMWVVATGRLDDIEEILGTRAEETTAVPLEYGEGHWTVAPTYINRIETRLPRRLLKAQPIDFRPVALVRNAQWVGEREIELQGCAYIPGVDPADLKVQIRGVMDGATIFDLPVEPRADNRIDLEIGDPWRSYETAGFRFLIDISRIENISHRGIVLVGSFEMKDNHLYAPATSTTVVGMTAPSPVVNGERVTVVADEHDELSILPVEMPPTPVLAKNVTFRGDLITLTLFGEPTVQSLELVTIDETLSLSADSRSIFSGSLPTLPDRFSSGGELIWTVRAQMADGNIVDVYHSAVDYLLPDTGRVRPEPNADGKVCISQRFRRVSITGASNDRDRLMITGRIDPPEKLSVVLKSESQTIAPETSSRHADGSFTAVYDLTTTGPEGGTVAALSGGYHVRYGTTPETADSWTRVAGKLTIRAVDCFTEWNTLRLEGRSSGAVAITASPPWSPRERTKYGRFALRTTDWGPVRGGILFESFNGKSTNDNPRALFDAIQEVDDQTPMYWSVRDRRVEVPPGGIPVVEGTVAWHRALATSRVWVNNNNFPYYVQKRPCQYYLQTWHGTPIKKLLWDIPRRKVPLTYRRLMRAEVAQWDLLLAQSDHAAVNLRTGLGYDGPIEVTEYPRNMRLLSGLDNPDEIRERLGIAGKAKVILYVPTWRDSHRAGHKLNWAAQFDPSELALEASAYVLVRSHHVANAERIEGPNVLDVSSEPHVEDLLAISDALITDYSSISFDFSLTGRPVFFLREDLESYQEERGLYPEYSHDLGVRPEDLVAQICAALSTTTRTPDSSVTRLSQVRSTVFSAIIPRLLVKPEPDYGFAVDRRIPTRDDRAPR